MDPLEEHPVAGDRSVVEQRLGPDRGPGIEQDLAAAGLVAIDVAALAELERQAAGYRRLARLVEHPDT